MLIDVVSKNGNLLLSIPLRGDGSIDDKARAVVEGIGGWMTIHREAIIGTRPWRIFGEGPAQEEAPSLSVQGFNEGKGKAFTGDDVRFTTKGNVLYAFIMGTPTGKQIRIKSLGRSAPDSPVVGKIQLLGSKDRISFQQLDDALEVQIPDSFVQNDIAAVLKIT